MDCSNATTTNIDTSTMQVSNAPPLIQEVQPERPICSALSQDPENIDNTSELSVPQVSVASSAFVGTTGVSAVRKQRKSKAERRMRRELALKINPSSIPTARVDLSPALEKQQKCPKLGQISHDQHESPRFKQIKSPTANNSPTRGSPIRSYNASEQLSQPVLINRQSRSVTTAGQALYNRLHKQVSQTQ